MAGELTWLSPAWHSNEIFGHAAESLETAEQALGAHPQSQSHDVAGLAAEVAQAHAAAKAELAAGGICVHHALVTEQATAERAARRTAERAAREAVLPAAAPPTAAAHSTGAFNESVDGTPCVTPPLIERPSSHPRSTAPSRTTAIERATAWVAADAERVAAALRNGSTGELLHSMDPPSADSDGAVLRTEWGDVLLVRSRGIGFNIHLHSRTDQAVWTDESFLAPPHADWQRLSAMRMLREHMSDLAFASGALVWRTGRQMEGVQDYLRAAANVAGHGLRQAEAWLSPMVQERTGQSEELEAAERLAALAHTDALGRLAEEEGAADADDVLEVLSAQWLVADQCGDEAEASRLLARMDAFSDQIDQLYADVRRIREADTSAEEARQREVAAATAIELAIEARVERRMERFARHALFEDLQRGWSDARFVAERSGLEDQDVEDGQRDGQEEIRVVECEDRLEGFDPAYP